jgi:hypothetical protein
MYCNCLHQLIIDGSDNVEIIPSSRETTPARAVRVSSIAVVAAYGLASEAWLR